MEMDSADLMSSLQLHNDFFKSMTDLIPARYYFEQEIKQGPAGTGKFHHNAKEKAPKQQLKDKSKKKTSNKRQRLDPDKQRSVTQIQEGMDKGQISGKDGVATSSRLWREKSEDESESDAVGTGLEDLSDDSGAEDDSKSPAVSSRIKPMSVESVSSGATIDELREKVQKRIEELRTKRKARAPLMEDMVPKKIARKEAEKEKKKKAEAYKAIKASKAQLEVSEKAKQKQMVNGDIHNDSDDSGDDGTTPQRTKKSDKKSAKGGKGGQKVAGGDDEAAVRFSQFDFAESEREQPKKKKRKKLTEPRSNKDFGRLLKKAELKEQKMAEMKEKDPDKAQEVETEGKWQTVIDKAQGIKVKDDVELLKKSIKRKEQRKKASKKQWDERKAKLEEKMKHKDAKKRTNIKAKTDGRKAKKVKRLQQKGKLLLQD
ncbi:surfeit locus protein 6 homolog [Strongylocentrotus purpuratus]|uniref:Surfeit locus protein 6 homolog n=1 Tax=Strongylocentrotus purpuratus TaxID=7668 RepID=A0A7M7GFT7_STRPU|nr:surfeit locus protein 6 homolog [Strongylocentrotus purpuratus]